MKENKHATGSTTMMSSITISPINAAYSPSQPQLPTPSPFSFSVASTRFSSRPPVQTANLLLRFLTVVLSAGSALSLAALSPTEKEFKRQSTSFGSYPVLVYSFIVSAFTFLYGVYQLSKGICDIAHRGIFISDKVSDYVSFICDQLAGYLLVSASSAAIPVIQHMYIENSLRKAAAISVCMSFTSFVIVLCSALLSGYKFCKRIVW